MKYEIPHHTTLSLSVFYNISKGDPGYDFYALVYLTHPDATERNLETIAEISLTSTYHGYLIQVMKMCCELKTANDIISFFNDPANYLMSPYD